MADQHTFDPALTTERDWVRLLLGDTDMSDPYLEDATIDAVLAELPSRYCAAAELAPVIFSRWQAKGAGIVEKQVSKLRIRRSEGTSARGVFDTYVGHLRNRCAESRMTAPSAFKVL